MADSGDWDVPPQYLTEPPFAGPGVNPRIELFGPIPPDLAAFYTSPGFQFPVGGLIYYYDDTHYAYIILVVNLSGGGTGPNLAIGQVTPIAVREAMFIGQFTGGDLRVTMGQDSHGRYTTGADWVYLDNAISFLQSAITIQPDFSPSTLRLINTVQTLEKNTFFGATTSVIEAQANTIIRWLSGGLAQVRAGATLEIARGSTLTIDGISAPRGRVGMGGSAANVAIGTAYTTVESFSVTLQPSRQYKINFWSSALLSLSTNVFQIRFSINGNVMLGDLGAYGPSGAAPAIMGSGCFFFRTDASVANPTVATLNFDVRTDVGTGTVTNYMLDVEDTGSPGSSSTANPIAVL